MPSPLTPIWWSFFILAAYLCGSIPWGLLIARSQGVDIRKVGSGNIGATNVGRVLGRKFGLICFFLDMIKGAGPVIAGGYFAGLLGQTVIAPDQTAWWLAVMIAPVLGHVLNPWLAFKGGKGVATSLGALLGVYPVLTIPGLLAFAVWVAFAAKWKYVSLASLAAAAVLPLCIAGYFAAALPRPEGSLPPAELYFRHAGPFIAVGVVLAALVFITHRANIRRLLSGTENRIGHSKHRAGSAAPTQAR